MNQDRVYRKSWLLLFLAVAAVATLGPGVRRDAKSAWAAPPGDSDASSPSVDTATVNAALGLKASTIVSLQMGRTPGIPVSVTVPLGGHDYNLTLVPKSVRSPDYQLLVQGADGSLVPTEPSPERTLRGWAREETSISVAGSVLTDGLHAVIDFDGDRYWIEPVGSRVAGATADQHVVYSADR